MNQRRFEVLIFSKNQEKVNRLLHSFRIDEWDKIRKSGDMCFYEGQHFAIKHMNRFPSETMRGHKVDLIYVDDELVNENYEMITHYINEVSPCNLAAQRFPIKPQLF